MALIGLLIWLVGIQMAITYVAEDGDRCSGPVTPVGCEHNHDPVTDVIAWGFLLISAAAIVGVVVSAWREKRQREAAQDLEGDGAPAALTADIWGEPQPPAPYPPAEPLYGYIRSSRMGYTPLMESSQPKVSEQIAREELAGHPWTPDQEERLAAYDRELARERERLHHLPAPDPKRIREELARDEDLRWRIFERDGYQCQICGSKRALTIAHIVPVSRGGTNAEDNLRTLCRSCSSRKGARPVD